MSKGTVHLVVPAGHDDPRHPSGGNTYDRRVARELGRLGLAVDVREVEGRWPWPDTDALTELGGAFADIPTRAVVVLDGLIASVAASVVVPAAERLRLVVLVHAPLGTAGADPVPEGTGAGEHEVLEAATAVITTSRWTRRHLLDHYGLWPGRVYVAEPGVDPAAATSPSDRGGRLLHVAAVVPHKGQDLLVDALTAVADLAWEATCAGALQRDPGFAVRVQAKAVANGLADRIRWTGPLAEADLAAEYAHADLVVVTSRAEAYGLVVTEALARGVPVLAADTGGIPEALGRDHRGRRPGLLVPPGESAAVAHGLHRWLADAAFRKALRAAAAGRRGMLRPWSWTAARIEQVLAQVAP